MKHETAIGEGVISIHPTPEGSVLSDQYELTLNGRASDRGDEAADRRGVELAGMPGVLDADPSTSLCLLRDQRRSGEGSCYQIGRGLLEQGCEDLPRSKEDQSMHRGKYRRVYD